MQRTLSAQLQHVTPGDQVIVEGWIHRRRTLAAVTFVILRDRTGLTQVVVKDPAVIEQMQGLGEETVVSVTATLVTNPSAPGGVELIDPTIEPLTDPAQTPPVELWRPTLKAGLPTLLDNAPVTLRHPRSKASWQLASARMQGFRQTLTAEDFTEIATPKLVGTSTESGANVFTVDYFGKQAFLAQSPQLYKQMLAGVFERVFEVGPVFRAEPHDTVRHIAEYVSLDAELGFIRDHLDVLAVLRTALAGMVTAIEETAAPAVELLAARLPTVPDEIPVLHFRDALKLVGANTVPRPRADHRWTTAAPVRRLPVGDRGRRAERGAVRRLPAGLPARDACARRFRDRPRTLGGTADRRREHPGSAAVPAGPEPAHAVERDGGARDLRGIGYEWNMTLTRLIARPMLASMFVVGGVNSLKNAEGAAQAAKPVTDKFVPMVQKAAPNAPIPSDAKTWVRINAGVHIVAGLALATGRAPRLSSLALAATVVPTTVAEHPFWEESDPGAKANQKIHFFKNLSMLGGLLLAGVDTEGKPGLAWRAKHAATDVRREARQLSKAAKREAKRATK